MAVNGASYRLPPADLTLPSTMTQSITTKDERNAKIDSFAWLYAVAANSNQDLSPPYYDHRLLDRNAAPSIRYNKDSTLVPSYLETASSLSLAWPSHAPNEVQPIATASAYSTSDEFPDLMRPAPASSMAMRPRSQLDQYGTTSTDKQPFPQSATSTVRFPARPKDKMSRRSSSNKTQDPKLAATQSSTRTPHNLIERRYRYKLQSEIDNLTSKVPGWDLDASASSGIDIENANYTVTKNRSKASAIAAAAKHLEHLERDNEKKADFIRNLQEQIEGLQKLVHCDDCSILRCLQAKGIIPSTASLEDSVSF